MMGLIFYFSSQPTLEKLDPVNLLDHDKLIHMGAYFALAASLWYPFKGKIMCIPLTLTISLLYGISDEYHQSFVPGRSCDIWDFFADTCGAVLFIATTFIIRRIKYERNKKDKQRRTENTGD